MFKLSTDYLYSRVRVALNQAIYATTSSSNYSTPQHLGIKFYQKKGSWPLRADTCPCDLEFAEYLRVSQTYGKAVFHFGTGIHHILGLENQKLEKPNHIIGITACAPEHQSYLDLVSQDRHLAKYYTVLCKDIYTLSDQVLPMFDVISLFHLSEFYFPGEAPYLHHDDASLLELFLGKLNPGGKLLFYPGSFAWDKAEQVVKHFETQGKIKQTGEFKHLRIYMKGV